MTNNLLVCPLRLPAWPLLPSPSLPPLPSPLEAEGTVIQWVWLIGWQASGLSWEVVCPPPAEMIVRHTVLAVCVYIHVRTCTFRSGAEGPLRGLGFGRGRGAVGGVLWLVKGEELWAESEAVRSERTGLLSEEEVS